MPVSSSTEHWIKQDALTINLNHFGDPDYLQVSILAGTVVMAFRKDVIGYNASHNYRTWPLQAANTYLETSSAVNVYARLTRSEVNALALIVYDTVLRDIEGREISYDENGNELLGESDPSFFYVFVGQISESLDRDGNKKPRAWNRSLVYGTLDSSEQKNYAGLLWEMMFTPHFDNPLNPDELTWIEAKKHLGVFGGVTMYADGGNLNLPSIYDGLPIDNNTIYWENGILKAKGGGGVAESVSWADITGKPDWLLDGKISYSEIEGTPDLSVYALKRSLSEYVTKTELTNLDYADKDWVKQYVVDINTGNITAITKQMVIDALGYTPYNSTNPNGYVTSESIPSLAGYATEDWVNKKGYLTSIPSEYVTETELTGKGYATKSDLDSRINALINGAPDAYDTLQEIADVLQGNVNSIGDILKALGGKADKAKTLSGYGITDAYTKTEVNTLLNDNATQTWVKSQGYLTQHQDLSGYQKLITSSNKLAYALISGTPTALPNPTALKFGTKSYDGSAERTILASDLGALTMHQTIYTLTFQSGTFAPGSFTANSGNKTINIPTTTSHVSEGSNLYFTNARAVSALGDTLKSYVTLSGSQTVSGEKNFTGGLKVNGSPIVYDAAKKYWKLEGDLLITGGLTMYGSDSSFTPSTIMDAIAVDGTTISKEGGVLKVIGGGGAITSITKQMVIDALGFTPISSSDVPTALPNPHSLKFGSKLYDGSASKTILASDLGALTAHQTIHSLTVKDSAGTTKLTYTPNSGTGSITLTKAMVGLGNVDNLAASGYLTVLSSDTTNAVSITVGGTTKSITSATMKASLGLGSLAYKSSLAASDIPSLDWSKITSGKPTTLTGYGISDAKIENGVITLGGKSITPLTGITSQLVTSALGYTPYNADNFTKTNIKSTLGISDWALDKNKPSYQWSDILGRPTLLSSFTDDVVAGKYLPLTGGTIDGTLKVTPPDGYVSVIRKGNTDTELVLGQSSGDHTFIGQLNQEGSTVSKQLSIRNYIGPAYLISAIDAMNVYSYVNGTNGKLGSHAIKTLADGNKRYAGLFISNKSENRGGAAIGVMYNDITTVYPPDSWNNPTKGANSVAIHGDIVTRTYQTSYSNSYYAWLKYMPDSNTLDIRAISDTQSADYSTPIQIGDVQINGKSVIHSGNIASQSVSYATSAGNANALGGSYACRYMLSVSKETANINSVMGFSDNRPFIARLASVNQEGYPAGDGGYGNLVHFGVPGKDTAFQLYSSYSAHRLLYRMGTWKADGSGSIHTTAWKTVAFTDSNVTSATRARYIETQMPNSDDWYTDRYRAYTRWGSDNYSILDWRTEGDYPVRVDIAKKLNTARTIWGQSFDGTGNVSGSLVLSRTNPIVVTDTESNTLTAFQLNNGNSLLIGQDIAKKGYETIIYGNQISFAYGNAGSVSNTALYISPSGNVGIGTTSPEGKLHIVGKLMLTNWDDDGTFLRIHNANKGKAFISIYSAYGNAYVFGQDGSRFLISHNNYGDIFNILNGNVGIGITEPSQKLHVDGNILTTGGVTMYSMRKLKNVVDERGLSLEELRTIKPTRYTWKDRRDNRIHFGGIADDIQQVLPEVVYNANGVLTMDYGNAGFAIASSLIKPVIDHEQRIKALEKENEELKQEIKRLKA